MRRIARWLRRRPHDIAPETTIPETGRLIPIEELVLGGRLRRRVDSACRAGTANRLRSLLTSALFSEEDPILYWPTSSYEHTIHQHDITDPSRIFATQVVPLSREASPPVGSIYNSDWHLLSPAIMQLPGDSRSFCIDALNGDGLKHAEMLYLMPDGIFHSFRSCLERLFRKEFLTRITALVSYCRQRRYGIFSLRYWVDCPRSLNLENLETRPLTSWSEKEQLRQYLQMICMQKRITRNPPSLAAFRSARQYMQEQGLSDILFTSDRWFNEELLDSHGSIQQKLANFKPGPERLIATLFVIANARIICRSKDSTYSQLPLLLADKWSARVLEI